MNMKRSFREVQHYLSASVWVVMIGAGIILAYFIYNQYFLDSTDSLQSESDFEVIVFVLPFFVLVFMLILMKLTTKIDENGVEFRYFPFFVHRIIPWDQMESVKVIHYGFMIGYGIRFWTKYGTVYNVKGNTGIFIQLKNGKKLMIGTQKGEEVKEVLLDRKL